MASYATRSDSLRAMYWRKEILQLLFWMRGEGFGDHLDASLLERALGVEARHGVRHLDELVDEGLLSCAGDRLYRLTAAGHRYGMRVIADEFVQLGSPEPGEWALGGCGVRTAGVGSRRPRRDRPRSRENGRRLT
ncbi:MAG: hypothetical protein GEU83_15940 [Pseudonocardiaceae bacterium]|nr:hypothetical protein [Pseudonocardiaceae bacterium]